MKHKKPYGARAVFFLIVLLILMVLVYYNIHSINKFKEIGQIIEPLDEDAYFYEKALHLYVSAFSFFFGNYPPTQVLAVLLPLSIASVILLLYNFTYFLKNLSGAWEKSPDNIVQEDIVNE